MAPQDGVNGASQLEHRVKIVVPKLFLRGSLRCTGYVCIYIYIEYARQYKLVVAIFREGIEAAFL